MDAARPLGRPSWFPGLTSLFRVPGQTITKNDKTGRTREGGKKKHRKEKKRGREKRERGGKQQKKGKGSGGRSETRYARWEQSKSDEPDIEVKRGR